MSLDRGLETRVADRPSRRAFNGAFHDYVRGVFADQSARKRLLRAKRAQWLHRLGERATAGRRSARGLPSR
jgi:hypothetical protein